MQRTSLDARIPASSLSWGIRFGPLSEAQVEELQAAMSGALPAPFALPPAPAFAPQPPPPAPQPNIKSPRQAAAAGGGGGGGGPATNGGNGGARGALAPDLEVLDLMVARLGEEAQWLRKERAVLEKALRAGKLPAPWPKRYQDLNARMVVAVADKNYVLAGALKQQIDDLKIMLEAVAAVNQSSIKRYGGGGRGGREGGSILCPWPATIVGPVCRELW